MWEDCLALYSQKRCPKLAQHIDARTVICVSAHAVWGLNDVCWALHAPHISFPVSESNNDPINGLIITLCSNCSHNYNYALYGELMPLSITF